MTFLDGLLVALPVDGGDGGRALQLQVAVPEVLVPHLQRRECNMLNLIQLLISQLARKSTPKKVMRLIDQKRGKFPFRPQTKR